MQTIKINYEAFGAEFANADNDKQALFFKGFARELANWTSDHNKSLQGCDVRNCLEKKDIEELRKFFDIIIND